VTGGPSARSDPVGTAAGAAPHARHQEDR
jgi:hypothetical protein